MRGKMSKLKGALIAGGVMAILGGGLIAGNPLESTAQAATKDSNGFYVGDVTPPWGRIIVPEAIKILGVNYVDDVDIEVTFEASDDMCADNEIKYYFSLDPISTTSTIADDQWKTYSADAKETVTLRSATAQNTLYVAFKDLNGNTSVIYSSTNQTITYDANASDATMATGTASKRVDGAPYVITMQSPEREGYFFYGWALTPNATTPNFYAGDVIPADMNLGTGSTVTLYAVWTTVVNQLVPLADVVEVGDYVNYPVYYANANTSCTYKGWRVISKNVDIDGNASAGTVNLVSAGVPLTYYHPGSNSDTSVTNLAVNFLTTQLHESDSYRYRTNRF